MRLRASARITDAEGELMLHRSLFVSAIAVACLYACGGTSPTSTSPSSHAQKGGGAKGNDARDAHQHVGGHAQSDRSHGSEHGAVYDDLTCDESLEGLAWCDSETELAFCSGGEWWVLDCSHPDIDGDFCGDNGHTVDCYVTAEVD